MNELDEDDGDLSLISTQVLLEKYDEIYGKAKAEKDLFNKSQLLQRSITIKNILEERGYNTKTFKDYAEFRAWFFNSDGLKKDNIEVTIPNEHGDPIVYYTGIQVLKTYEEG